MEEETGVRSSGESGKRCRGFAFCALFLLAACAGGNSDKPAATPPPVQMVYPSGLLTTNEALTKTQGVYAVPAGGGERCCWVDQDVRFMIPVSDGATTLHVDVISPGVPGFIGRKQSITQLDGNGKAVAMRAVPVGPPTSLTFPLPGAGARGNVMPVHLRMSMALIPHDAGVGGDTRRLAVIIVDAYAR